MLRSGSAGTMRAASPGSCAEGLSDMMLAPGRRLDLDERPFRDAVTRRCAESDVTAAQQRRFVRGFMWMFEALFQAAPLRRAATCRSATRWPRRGVPAAGIFARWLSFNPASATNAGW